MLYSLRLCVSTSLFMIKRPGRGLGMQALSCAVTSDSSAPVIVVARPAAKIFGLDVALPREKTAGANTV